jgi:hypothetical protein
MTTKLSYVNRYRVETGEFVERVKLTSTLLMTLAKYNSMNSAQVSLALHKGETLYGAFSTYKMADDGKS